MIEIDIPARRIHLAVSGDELARRAAAMAARGTHAWKPAPRERAVSPALRIWGAFATSASTGATRDLQRLADLEASMATK